MEKQNLFFEKLVETKVIRHKHSTNGKLVSTKVIIANEGLAKHCKYLFETLPKTKSYEEFIAEYIFIIHKAIMNFKIRDNGTWDGILDGTDKKNIGRIFKSARTAAQFELYHYVNDIKKISINNEKVDVKVNDFASLEDKATEDLTIMETVSKSFWDKPEGATKKNDFLQWFEDNKENILTKSQVEFLNKMAQASHEHGGAGYTKNDVAELTGVSVANRAQHIKRINKRVLKAWDKHQANLIKKSVPKNKELAFLLEGIGLVERGNSDELFVLWLRMNINKPHLMNLLYDGFEESYELVRVLKSDTYKQQTLYKIFELIEKRVEVLNRQATTFTNSEGATPQKGNEGPKVLVPTAFGTFEQVHFEN